MTWTYVEEGDGVSHGAEPAVENVSETSVSRLAALPQDGQVVCTNDSTVARGETPEPVGRKSVT